jgi:hypothetical protein
MNYRITDSLTGQDSRDYASRETAADVCRALNRQPGAGGRFQVQPTANWSVVIDYVRGQGWKARVENAGTENTSPPVSWEGNTAAQVLACVAQHLSEQELQA